MGPFATFLQTQILPRVVVGTIDRKSAYDTTWVVGQNNESHPWGGQKGSEDFLANDSVGPLPCLALRGLDLQTTFFVMWPLTRPRGVVRSWHCNQKI